MCNKIIKKSILLLLATIICIGGVSGSVSATPVSRAVIDSNIISMDMYDYPKATQDVSPQYVFDNYVYPAISWKIDEYYATERQYIIDNYPMVDIALVDEFITTISGKNAELSNKFGAFEVIYQNSGYLDANLYSEELGAVYGYQYDRYGYVTSFIHTHGDMGDTSGYILNYFRDYLSSYPYLSPHAYNALPYADLTFMDPVEIEALYDEIYQQASLVSSDPDEVDKMVSDIMEEAIRSWIHEVDIDYFISFQVQVELYLQNLKEMDYVFDLDNDVKDFSWNVTNGRALILGDFLKGGSSIYLNPGILEVNLNDDGTAFIPPEDVYNSDLIQTMIESIMSPFEDTGAPDFYSKANVINYAYYAISSQYSALYAPGSYSQPILNAFPQLINSDAMQYYDHKGTYPELTNWIEVGDTVPVYDQYRRLNYIKVPFVNLKEETTNEVKRTVHYIFEDGTPSAPDEVQSAQFDVVKELISGRITGDTTPQTLPAIANPVVTYPEPGVVVLDPANSVEALDVTYDSDDVDITIMYPLEFQLGVFYVDENGNTLKDEGSIQGRYNTLYDVSAPVIEGYQLAQEPANASGTFGINRDDITFVYQKGSKTGTLPETGDFPGVGIVILAFGLTLTTIVFVLKAAKKRKKL